MATTGWNSVIEDEFVYEEVCSRGSGITGIDNSSSPIVSRSKYGSSFRPLLSHTEFTYVAFLPVDFFVLGKIR